MCRKIFTHCSFLAILFSAVLLMSGSNASAQQSEASINKEYHNIIMQYLQKDVNSRQAKMRQRAEEMLVALPNNRKLYNESLVQVDAQIVPGKAADSSDELNYVITINYNCRSNQGATDDYGSGQYLLEQSNSSRALCELANELLTKYNDDLFTSGKRVSIEITGSTDETPINKRLKYAGEYGDFQYQPTHFNGEDVRVSINDSTGITNNAQLAYLRAQGIHNYLQQVSSLQKTTNDYTYITRCYGETGAAYRRSGIQITLHGAFNEMMAYMNEILINDEFIEYNIPTNAAGSNVNTYAVVIANEDYEAPFPNCPYAWRDATVMREYFVKTLGIPERHVKVLKNASIAQIQEKGINWLKDILKATNGNASLIVYYSGYGISNFDYNPYIIPCGMDLSKVRTLKGKANIDITSQLSKHDSKALLEQCLAVDTLCKWFNRVVANNVTFIFDAGFNGYQRDGEVLVQLKHNDKKARGLRLRNDIVIFNAADFKETVYSYDKQQHGFLTYFICKELKRTKGNIDYGDLFDNVKKLISYESSLQGKLQEPIVTAGGKVKDTWQTMRFIKEK